MSLLFNKRFEEMKEGDPTSKENAIAPEDLRYPDNGQGRNLIFLWPNGSMLSLNYSYLISGKLDTEANKITLKFTSCIVEICGISLKSLLLDIADQRTRLIICVDYRYKSLEDNNAILVFQIDIKEQD